MIKNLVATSFRRRLLTLILGVMGCIILLMGSVIYYQAKHQLIHNYTNDAFSHIASVANEIQRSNVVAPFEKWPEIYPRDAKNISVVICDNNDNELWRSLSETIFTTDTAAPKTSNLCVDLPFPINSIKLVEQENSTSFVAHVLPMKETTYNPQGRIILLKTMEQATHNLNTLRLQIAAAVLVILLVSALCLSYVYRRGFRSFNLLDKELQDIKQGNKKQLEGQYPEDLAPIKHSLNKLLHQVKDNEERYKRSMDDLAHSLKTRIAVIHAITEQEHPSIAEELNIQLAEMDQLIQAQLKRAKFGVKGIAETKTPFEPVLDSLLGMFNKIHIDRHIQINKQIAQHLVVPLNKDDLMEVLGNILENNYRYAVNTIQITARQIDNNLLIEFSNDGPNINENIRQELFQRGVRADEKNPGTGLGLALCDEIIHSYKGTIWFEEPESPSMGVSLKILIPYD